MLTVQMTKFDPTESSDRIIFVSASYKSRVLDIICIFDYMFIPIVLLT